jgi:putative transposase
MASSSSFITQTAGFNTCPSATPSESQVPAVSAASEAAATATTTRSWSRVIGPYKTELVRNKGPWRGLDDVEIATLEWVDWWNHRRLLEPIGRIPPAEAEAAYYSHGARVAEVRTQETESL